MISPCMAGVLVWLARTHLDHVDERVPNIALVLEINGKVEEVVGALQAAKGCKDGAGAHEKRVLSAMFSVCPCSGPRH
jgi:hypothetical protein